MDKSTTKGAITVNIVLYVLGALAALVVVVLCLPVKVVLNNDGDVPCRARVYVLFKVFDSKSKKKPKKKSGKAKTKKSESPFSWSRFHQTIKEDGLIATIKDTLDLLKAVLRELFRLVRHVRVTKLNVQVVCAGEDAAATALKHGRCCALVYPVLGYVHSLTNVNPKNETVHIRPDFIGDQDKWDYEMHLSVRVAHIAAAALRFLFKESARFAPKPPKSSE